VGVDREKEDGQDRDSSPVAFTTRQEKKRIWEEDDDDCEDFIHLTTTLVFTMIYQKIAGQCV